MDEPSTLKSRMQRQGLTVALNHLDQAESSLGRGEWESANGQVRACLEALFDAVARIRLGSSKTGGAARKELQTSNILAEREGKLVQTFIDVAGGAGAHAGTSTEDEARGRFLAGLGICYLGLALIPEVIRVQDVLAAKLTAPPGRSLPTDAEIRARCPTCGEEQFLSEAPVARDNQDTVYTCRNGCQPIVVIGSPGDSPWPGRGYNIGGHVVRNACDLILAPASRGGQVLIPASPAALKKT
jgi:hypothetical protein